MFKGIVVALLGFWFLAKNLNWIELDFGQAFHTYWPLLLIGFGLSMIFKSRSAKD